MRERRKRERGRKKGGSEESSERGNKAERNIETKWIPH